MIFHFIDKNDKLITMRVDKTDDVYFPFSFICDDLSGRCITSGTGSKEYIIKHMERYVVIPPEILERLHVELV